ncbi:MAG: T9SS C-terminal target domain-containing protein, partial [Ignavibacteriales bacterium]
SSEVHTYSYTVDKLLSLKNYFRLRQVDFDGTFEYSSVVEVDGVTPSEFYLAQNHPNPFNLSTSIQFSLPVESSVQIELFNMLGEKITEITNSEFSTGVHTINFRADNLSSGTYLYLLRAEGNDGSNFYQTKKMILLK